MTSVHTTEIRCALSGDLDSQLKGVRFLSTIGQIYGASLTATVHNNPEKFEKPTVTLVCEPSSLADILEYCTADFCEPEGISYISEGVSLRLPYNSANEKRILELCKQYTK
jgi:hypothetical protein